MQRRKRLTLLIAQQEDFERDRMAALLSMDGAQTLTARNGREALEAVKESRPDILVTDVVLDGLDGLELIRRAKEAAPTLRVILAAGPYNPKAALDALELGIDAFLRLPVPDAALREAVMRCARDAARARRMAQADFSLRHLLDFFPGPAALVDGETVTYMNRRLAQFLGYAHHDDMGEVDMGLEDFILKMGGEPYDGSPAGWVRAIVDDPLDRDHVLHIENPRHPDGRPNVFTVAHNQFPGSDMRLFSFQDVSGLDDERERLKDEASTDPLTKALNRRSFHAHLSGLTGLDQPFALIMFDIDHFKSINDSYGHDVGDTVLKEIAALVRVNIRVSDVFARWGGEEFMVLSPDADLESGKQLAERLRESVAGFDFTGVPRQVSSSFGLAVFTGGELADELVKRADEALYEAKESGRNRVVVGDPKKLFISKKAPH